MSNYYGAALRENPSGSKVSTLTARAVELEAAFRVGILPRVGGWDDQDPNDVFLIQKAANVRTTREAVERRKRESKRGMFKKK